MVAKFGWSWMVSGEGKNMVGCWVVVGVVAMKLWLVVGGHGWSHNLVHRKKLINLMIWREMFGFSHQFPIAWENATKPIVWGESGKSVIILFP